jgi:uncharacterized protein
MMAHPRLVSRFRSSPHLAEHSHANFGIERTLARIETGVVLDLKSLRRGCRNNGRGFKSTTLGAVVVAALALLVAITALAAPSFPALTGRVVDPANLFDQATEARLTAKLADLEAKTTTQLVVVTLPSLQDYDIADYGYQLGRHWGIGQKGTNNGAILIVAPNERRVRIEVGYGLEGMLTDAVTRLIITNAILPRFRTGDFAGGVERGVDDIIQVLAGDAEDFKRRAAEHGGRPSGGEGLSFFVVVIIILVIWFLIFRAQSSQPRFGRRSRSGPIFLPPIGGGGWQSGSGRGGGWSGGGGGGFSGGGGSFGGGGSSGSW